MEYVTVELPPRPLADDAELASAPDAPIPLFAVVVLIAGLFAAAFALRPIHQVLHIGYGSELLGSELVLVTLVIVVLTDRALKWTARTIRWPIAMGVACLLASDLVQGLIATACVGLGGWPNPALDLLVAPLHVGIWVLVGWLMAKVVASKSGMWWKLAVIPMAAEPLGAFVSSLTQATQTPVPSHWSMGMLRPLQWLPEMACGAALGLTIAASMAWALSRRRKPSV